MSLLNSGSTPQADRNRCRAFVERVAHRPDVLGCDLIDPSADVHDSYVVEVAVDADAIPAGILRELGHAGLACREIRPQGDWMVVIAVAEGDA